MFYRAPFFLPWIYPHLHWRVPVTEKILYITLDDGPVSGPTDFALETLKKFEARATFFCIGDNIQKHPEIFLKLIADGHAVGNHTYHHVNGWQVSLDEYIKEVKQCDVALSGFLPVQKPGEDSPKLFRPPYGRITRTQIQALAKYKIMMWDVLSHDYNKRISPEACLRNSIRATRPGSIVVFHDSVKAEKNMAYAFPRYLDHFRHKGYSFHMLPV